MIRELYLRTAMTVFPLLRDPAVAAAWDGPSALEKFSVCGLAGHLARQIFSVSQVLDRPATDAPLVTLFEHYTRSSWVGADVDSEDSIGVREHGEELAAGGAQALAAEAESALATLRRLLPEQPADRVVSPPWTGWSLTLDDFLATRMLELAVHGDDLAVSVGVAPPALPGDTVDLVVGLLARLAVHRHGATPVLRALSRSERAPASIAAI